jgi:hypothetical protein
VVQADGALMVNFDPKRYGVLRTDARGRVTFPTLIPDGVYHVTTGEGVTKEFTAKAGRNLDLGDLTMKRPAE